MFQSGLKILFDGYLTETAFCYKSLCDGYVIETPFSNKTTLKISYLVCDGHVIEKPIRTKLLFDCQNKLRNEAKLMSSNTFLFEGYLIETKNND